MEDHLWDQKREGTRRELVESSCKYVYMPLHFPIFYVYLVFHLQRIVAVCQVAYFLHVFEEWRLLLSQGE